MSIPRRCVFGTLSSALACTSHRLLQSNRLILFEFHFGIALHSESEHLRQCEFDPDQESGFGSKYSPKLNGSFPSLCKDASVIKNVYEDLVSSFQRYEQICGKIPYLAMSQNLKKIPTYGSIHGWLPKYKEFFPGPRTHLVIFSWRYDQ